MLSAKGVDPREDSASKHLFLFPIPTLFDLAENYEKNLQQAVKNIHV